MKLRNTILRSLFLIMVVLGCLSPFGTLAREKSEKLTPKTDLSSGFYYDAEREKYFSNEKSKFSIRPSNNANYVERIEVSIDGSEFTSYNGSFAFQSEGVHQVRFRAADPVLNWSPIQTYRVYVDKTPPKSQVVWQGPTFSDGKQLYVNPNTRLTILSQDNLSGVHQVHMIQDGVSKVFPGQMLFGKEGNYSIQFSAVDNVGNIEIPYHANFVVDAKAPETHSKVIGTSFENSKGIYVSSGSRVELTAVDVLSGVNKIEYRVNDGPATIYSNPILFSENKTQIRYRGIDNVGNEETWKTLVIYQDTKPPRVSIQKVGDSVTIGGRIYAKMGFKLITKISDDESGVKEILVSRDGKTFNHTKDSEFSFDTKGEHQFKLKATDNTDNFEESNPYTIVIDNDPPASTVKTAHPLVQRDNVFLASVPNRLEFQATDDGVGVDHIEVSYDGKRFETLKSPIELSEWKVPRQTIFYRAIDRLGNVEVAKKLEILVKTTGPGMDLFVEADNLPNVPLSSILNRNGRTEKSEDRGERTAPARIPSSVEQKDESEKKDSD